MRVWICGKYIEKGKKGVVWEFAGVFDSPQKAMAACLTKEYFVAPETMNEYSEIDKTVEMRGCFYPLIDAEL